MKLTRYIFILLLLMGSLAVISQETESNPVTFRLNNLNVLDSGDLPDTRPPSISIIAPEMGTGKVYHTEVAQIDLLGEVKDESKIRFVQVNNEIRTVNETGVFATTLRLSPGQNQIRIRAMDEHSNLQDQSITIEYTPPVVTLADRINEESKYYGLIIGINDYLDDNIPDLDNPIDDAESIYKTLTRKYTFDPDNIKLLTNPRRIDIIRELDRLKNAINTNDNLLIFYAGHGYWDEDGRIGYWLPSDASKDITADWFRNSTLVDYVQAIHSKHTLLITDACFAGSIFKARSVDMKKEIAYEKIYDMPSRKAMTSGNLTEVPDESAFIRYLIRRLIENEETYLSSEELFYSFRMAVMSNSNSSPRYGEIQNVGNEGGDFIFLKRE